MPTDPPPQLTTQEQFDVFTDAVARALGPRCRAEPLPQYSHKLARRIIDDHGRAVRLLQFGDGHPLQLRAYGALPDDSPVSEPWIGVRALSADHVAHQIRRRLYPLHAEAIAEAQKRAEEIRAEETARRAVSDLLAAALPGARVQKTRRRTRLTWDRASWPPEAHGATVVDDVQVEVGPSGSWLRVEASGRAQAVARMLTAFTQGDPTEG
ncbi:hypothetical protein [Streptomyces minutiscleroticus]|uniref:hypothetical protein n=1 Tax=Streptomyces minutiscleroticus TaxID=68238 RepID=UPI0033183504